MKTCLVRADLERAGALSGFDPDDPVIFPEPSVVIDSRKIKGGEIFVALQGEHTDGHHFVRGAFESGAVCAVVSSEWYKTRERSSHVPQARYLVADDTVKAMQMLAESYRLKFGIPVIGIGGSNGKTTTKEMTASVLGSRFRTHMSEGNLNNHLGVPLTLFGLREQHEMAVVEMGINHPGEMELLCGIAGPTHGLLTNIGHEHLEFLRDLEGVKHAETALFRYLLDHGGTAFVNRDDRMLADAASGFDNAVAYGTAREGASIWAEDIRLDVAGNTAFTLCSSEGAIPVTLQFAGRHNVLNAVAASAIGMHFGLSLEEIRDGLEGSRPGRGWKRLEFQDIRGLTVINDTYNANPDSVRHALDVLCELPGSGKRIAVIGDMFELGRVSSKEHERIGRYASSLDRLDALYTFGEQSVFCCRSAGDKCSGHFTDNDMLLDLLNTLLKPGDTLLLKGSRGMRMERFVDGLMQSYGLEQ